MPVDNRVALPDWTWSRRDFLRRAGASAAFGGLLAGGMGFLESCGGTSQAASSGNAVRGGHLVEATISDISNINPILATETASLQITALAYDPLITCDAAGNLMPAIAAELPTVDSNQRTYHMKLRHDVKWSDGQPLTADDVVFTYRLIYHPDYKAVASRFRARLEEYLADVSAPDPYTVVFTLTKPYAPFYDSTLVGPTILPKHVWEKLSPQEINTSDMNQLPTVVSGVMVPVRWDKGSQYVMKRNEKYWRGPAHLDSYVYKVVPQQTQVANQLQTGEVDVGQSDPGSWDSLAQAQNVDRVTFVSPGFDWYIQNLDPAKTPKAAIFGDVQVRRALLTSLDRKKIAQRVYFGQAVPADSSMGRTSWAHVTPKTQYPFDPDKANKMLESAGWKRGADGVRTKNGMRLEWELTTQAGSQTRQTLSTVMAEEWKQIGANVTIRLQQFPQVVTELTRSREFDMILLGIAETLDPDSTSLWGSTSIGNGLSNGADYRNPKVDALLDEGVAVVDRTKRKKTYAQMQEILMTDLPSVLLTYPKALWGISKRVKGFKVGPFNQWSTRPWFKDVYVSDGK